AVGYADESLKMPPKGKLPADELADLEKWVRIGVPDPRSGSAIASKSAEATKGRDLWSLRPVRDPAVPTVKAADGTISSVDRFILATLEARGLRPAPPAGKRTLIRRATYDLTGLPPTPDEIEGFIADDSPGAFAKVVDRL